MTPGTGRLAMVLMMLGGLGCAASPMEPGDRPAGTGGTVGGGLSSSGAGGGPASSGLSSTVPGSGGVGSGSSFAATGGATAIPTLPGAGGTTSGGGSGGAAGSIACSAQAVTWQTSTVSLHADAFWIVANGLCFTTRGAAVRVTSDPGGSQYTTLELVWTELGREMRWFIYLYADATSWWSNEMRTYDGRQTYPDWLFYSGNFFPSPIGQPFRGNLDLTNDASDEIRGELHLRGLTLSTTMTGR